MPLGGKLLIDGAINIAMAFNIAPAVIGLTLVALGTSLPELATSLSAAYHKRGDIVIGNIIGSNLFNLLAIPGDSRDGRPPTRARAISLPVIYG